MATVVSGEWHFAYGNHFDEKVLKTLPPGSVYSEPGGDNHFARTDADSVIVEISGYGPTGHALFRGQDQSQDEREELTTTIGFAADADRGFISLPCNASRNADHLGAG